MLRLATKRCKWLYYFNCIRHLFQPFWFSSPDTRFVTFHVRLLFKIKSTKNVYQFFCEIEKVLERNLGYKTESARYFFTVFANGPTVSGDFKSQKNSPNLFLNKFMSILIYGKKYIEFLMVKKEGSESPLYTTALRPVFWISTVVSIAAVWEKSILIIFNFTVRHGLIFEWKPTRNKAI